MPSKASDTRVRVGAELRRLRERAGLSGEQVATTLGWSQPKISRMEAGRTAYTVNDVANLLALYGVEGDVRMELLASTAQDTGEGAWIIRAGGYPRRQGSVAALEAVTNRIRHYQPVVVPGLLQTWEYAKVAAEGIGAPQPEKIADARMVRQAVLDQDDAPSYEVVVDARALLLPVASVELLRDQALSLAERATHPRVDLRVVPLAAGTTLYGPVGYMLFDFINPMSPSVAWIESPTGDICFSDPDDIERYTSMFRRIQDLALAGDECIRYMRSFADDVERYVTPSD